MSRAGWAAVLLAVVMAVGCSRSGQACMEQENSVYFWRTELCLDSMERQFLSDYHIKKVYCRYFDVVVDTPLDSPEGGEGEPHPNATLAFADTLPSGITLVPTVYITEACMHQRHEGLARRIVDRIVQMNETNDIRGVGEVQMDCDYTDRSRATYYQFLREVRQEAERHGLRLSTTIRLHQLSMPVPPVDYGVLMLYNTGDPRRFEERNPILDRRDVAPYVHRLPAYDLPLAAAYPVYRWQRQVQGVRIEHIVEADEILAVKQMVERQRPDLCRSIITYHLDEENIKRYSYDTYKAIYHH